MGDGVEFDLAEMRKAMKKIEATEKEVERWALDVALDKFMEAADESDIPCGEDFYTAANIVISKAIFERCIVYCRKPTILEIEDRRNNGL